MERSVDMKEISDGKLYGPNDLVRADARECRGCSACCRGMGNSIVLDPLDVYRLTGRFSCSFEQLMSLGVELNVVDGVILPNLKMTGEDESCAFLNEEGRCSIHPSRPGICRLFPLGRFYEDESFRYFLQVHECKQENRLKVKVKKWVDTPNLKENEAYITAWHYFLKKYQQEFKDAKDLERMRAVDMYILRLFFQEPYEIGEDFYPQFYRRLKKAEEELG